MHDGMLPCVQDKGSPAALGSNQPKSLHPSPSLFQGHKPRTKFITKKLKLNDIVISGEKVPPVVIYVQRKQNAPANIQQHHIFEGKVRQLGLLSQVERRDAVGSFGQMTTTVETD